MSETPDANSDHEYVPPVTDLHYHHGVHVSPEGWAFPKVTACLTNLCTCGCWGCRHYCAFRDLPSPV